MTTNTSTQPPALDKVWTLAEVAEYLQITERTAQRLMQMNQLPCIRVGHSVRFHPLNIAELVRCGGKLLTVPAKPPTTCAT